MALGCLVKCRRTFPVEWRSGEWNQPERGQCLWMVRQVPFFTSPREFNRREAVPASNFQKLGTFKAIGWRVGFTLLTDTVKMIAYRAETALVGLLRPHLAKEDEARALIRELFVSAADIEPDERENTLTIRIHRMACPAHDKAIGTLLAELTLLNFLHPETHARLIYQLA